MIKPKDIPDFSNVRRKKLEYMLEVYAGLQKFGGGYQAEITMIQAELDKKRRPVDEKATKC